MLKKIKIIFLMLMFSFLLSACSLQNKATFPEPSISQIRQICELSTLECYYHNVAKSVKSAGSGWGHWGEKSRKFWIEYTGIAQIGIDMSKVHMDINDNVVTVYVPEAQILNIEVDQKSLNENSFYIENPDGKNKITADDQTQTINAAQNKMEMEVSENKSLLLNARERAMSLIENYILQLGSVSGREYKVVFVVDDNTTEALTEKAENNE